MEKKCGKKYLLSLIDSPYKKSTYNTTQERLEERERVSTLTL